MSEIFKDLLGKMIEADIPFQIFQCTSRQYKEHPFYYLVADGWQLSDKNIDRSQMDLDEFYPHTYAFKTYHYITADEYLAKIITINSPLDKA